jgi:trimeric autotransporter adhesin
MKKLLIFLTIVILSHCGKGASSSDSSSPFFLLGNTNNQEGGGVTTSVSEGATLKKIQIEPSVMTIIQNTNAEFSAVAIYSDGTKLDVTEVADWDLYDSNIAEEAGDAKTLNYSVAAKNTKDSQVSAPIKRRFKAKSAGKTKIKASMEGISGECELVIKGVSVDRIEITKYDFIGIGSTVPYSAIAILADGTTQDISNSVKWSVSSETNGTIDAFGNFTALGGGNIEIIASLGGIIFTSPTNLSKTRIVSLSFSGNTSIVKGTLSKLNAYAIYEDGSKGDVTGQVTWSIDDSQIAKGNYLNTAGQFMGWSTGSTTVRISLQGINFTDVVKVTSPMISSISIPPKISSPNGVGYQYTAIAIFTDGTVQDVTSQTTWISENTNILSISNSIDHSGYALPHSVGNVKIGASISGVQTTSIFTVTPALLTSISIEGEKSVAKGLSTSLKAIGFYSDGSSKDLTEQSTWSNEGVGEINNLPGIIGVFNATAVGSSKISLIYNNKTANTVIKVTEAKLLSISITPSNTTIPKGMISNFSATGLYTDNSKIDLTKNVTWLIDSNNDSIDDSGVAQIQNTKDSEGILKSLSIGTAKIYAKLGEIKSSTNLTVSPAELVSISLGAPQKIPNGLTGKIVAMGIFTDNSTSDITKEVSFVSSGKLFIDQTTGQIITAGVENVVIRAIKDNKSTSITINVTPAELTSISITPNSISIPKGSTLQLKAVATYTDNTTSDITNSVTWIGDGDGDGKNDTSIASINNSDKSGFLSSTSTGNLSVKASLNGISGVTSISITPAELVSISLGGPQSIPNGLSLQLKAIGTYTDNSTQDITNSLVWASSGKAVISSSDSSSGLLVSAGEETVSVRASSKTLTANVTITILPAEVLSLSISESEIGLAKGTTKKLTVNGYFTDGTSKDLTSQVTFLSDSNNDGLNDDYIISVSNMADSKGSITAIQIGKANIKSILGKVSITSSITVSAAELISITVTPGNQKIAKGLNLKYSATGFYSDNTTQDITNNVTWAVTTANSVLLPPFSSALIGSSGAIANISNSSGTNGLVSSQGIGEVGIMASLGKISGSANLIVGEAQLVGLNISSSVNTKAKGMSEQFKATGLYTDNSNQDLTSQVGWKSDGNNDGNDDNLIVSISNIAESKGLATGIGIGETNIIATLGSISASKKFTISPAVLSSISVESPNTSRPKGLSEQFFAIGTYSDNTTRDISSNVTWKADSNNDNLNDNLVGNISSTTPGLVNTVNIGSVVITASSGNISNSKTLNVLPSILIGITVYPPVANVIQGFVQQYTAVGTYTDGSNQDITSNVTWKVDSNNDGIDDTLIGSISNSIATKGITLGTKAGTAKVSALLSGYTYSSILNVLAASTVSNSDGNKVQIDEISTKDNPFNFQTNRVIGIQAIVIDQTGKPVPGALVELYNTAGNCLLFSQISSVTGQLTGSIVVNYTDTGIMASLAANVTANGSKQLAVPIRRDNNGDIKLVINILGVQVTTTTDNTGSTGSGSSSGGNTGSGNGGTTPVVVDSDNDGVPDSKDIYPNDPNKAFKVRIPATGYYTLSFEDLYPTAGDADLNDYTLYLYFEEDINANGDIIEIRSRYQHVAKGAGYNHSLYLRLPPSISISNFTTTIFDSRGVNLNSGTSLNNPGSSITSALPIYNNQDSSVTIPSQNVTSGSVFNPGRIAKTVIRFSTPVKRSVLGTAPYDLYAKVITTGREIHFPGKYYGNQFGAGKDDYLDANGFPWAVLVAGEFKWPLERQNIYTAYAKFTNWSKSKGAYDNDWYLYFDTTKVYTSSTGPSTSFFQ